MKYVTPIEMDGHKWYLAIGKQAPWDRALLRVPKRLALIFRGR
jgi:hypothetical protein